jgi:hypothetical protein
MRTIALNLLFGAAIAFAADPAAEQIQTLADALSAGEPARALDVFDPKMPGFDQLKSRLDALANLPDTTAEIRIESRSESSFVTHFELRLNPERNAPMLIRTERVSIAMARVGDEWRIVRFEPLRIFDPPETHPFARIAGLASALSESDGYNAARFFDSAMPDRAAIAADIDALVSQNDVLCAIDVIADHQTGDIHDLDTDWYLELKSKADAGSIQRRRDRVRVRMELKSGEWRITAISPESVLSPVISPR